MASTLEVGALRSNLQVLNSSKILKTTVNQAAMLVVEKCYEAFGKAEFGGSFIAFGDLDYAGTTKIDNNSLSVVNSQ